jgi:hypothetical protein
VGNVLPQDIVIDVLSYAKKSSKIYLSDDEKKQSCSVIRSRSYENSHLSIIEGSVSKPVKTAILELIKQYYNVKRNNKFLFSEFKKHPELSKLLFNSEILDAIIYKNSNCKILSYLNEIFVGGLALKQEYIKPLIINRHFTHSNILNSFNQYVHHKNKIASNTDIPQVFKIASFIEKETPLCSSTLKCFTHPLNKIIEYIELCIDNDANKDQIWNQRRYISVNEMTLALFVLNIRMCYNRDNTISVHVLIDANSPKYLIDYNH